MKLGFSLQIVEKC